MHAYGSMNYIHVITLVAMYSLFYHIDTYLHTHARVRTHTHTHTHTHIASAPPSKLLNVPSYLRKYSYYYIQP